MPDNEKIIAELQDAAAYFRSSFDAMYGTVACEKFRSWTDAIEQALALLKAQEPRVMTLEEVDALGDDAIVWLECMYTVDGKKTTTMKPAIYQAENSSPEEDGYYCVVSSWGKSGFYHKDSYLGDWRCWTSRPTDEQREATAWES